MRPRVALAARGLTPAAALLAAGGCHVTVQASSGRSASPAYVVAGALVAVFAGLIVLKQMRSLRRSERAVAVAVGLRRGVTSGGADGSAGASTYRPALRFRTTAGQEIETAAHVATGPAAARTGQQVPVRYDPAEPASVVIDTFWGRGTWIGVCMMVLGLFFAALGLAGMLA